MKTFAVLFLSLAFACMAFAGDDARKAQEDDIREAVLRHLLPKKPDKVVSGGWKV